MNQVSKHFSQVLPQLNTTTSRDPPHFFSIRGQSLCTGGCTVPVTTDTLLGKLNQQRIR